MCLYDSIQYSKYMCINILRGECGTWDQTTSAPEEYMAYGHNRYAAFNHNILHRAFASQHFPWAPTLWRQALTRLHGFKHCKLWYYCIFWNVESGSFSYLRNSVCKYIRNSAEFRQILLQKYRGIPYVFQKLPYSVGSQKRTSVDTLVSGHGKYEYEILPEF